MSTHTDEKRYLTDLAYALRLRKISGVRIGEILAEVEAHTAESGQSALDAFGNPKEYARQFEPTADGPGHRLWGKQAWTGALTAAIGAWLFAAGAFAGMAGENLIRLPRWWACAIGGVILLVTFSLIPLDTIVDPRHPNSRRLGRRWFMSWLVGIMVVVLLIIVGVMLLLT